MHRYVLDTNVLVASLSSRSPHHYNLSNIMYITRYFRWNLIVADPDDDKFVDCAVAAQAKFIVSEDKHFNVLKKDPTSIVKAIKIAEFKIIMGKDVS